MAPKRGGGSSSSSSGGSSSSSGGGISISNACSSSRTIDEPIVIAIFVIDGLALTILLVTWLMWLRKKRRLPTLRETLSWPNFGLLILLFIIVFILAIVNHALTNCNLLRLRQQGDLTVAISVLDGFVFLLLLAAYSYFLVNHVFALANTPGAAPLATARIAKLVNALLVLFIVLLWIPTIVLRSYSLRTVFDVRARFKWASLRAPSRDLSAAYVFLYFVVSIVSSAFLILATVRARASLPSRSKAWLIFTMVVFFISNLVAVVDYFGFVLVPRSLTEAGAIVFAVFESIFAVLTVLGILMSVATSAPNAVPADPSLDPSYKSAPTYAYVQQSAPQGAIPPTYQQPPPQNVPTSNCSYPQPQTNQYVNHYQHPYPQQYTQSPPQQY